MHLHTSVVYTLCAYMMLKRLNKYSNDSIAGLTKLRNENGIDGLII